MFRVLYAREDGGAGRVFADSLPDRRTADHVAVQLFAEGLVAASWVEDQRDAIGKDLPHW
ncbi:MULTISPECIES: hypothetical protein [unclassified Saccharopolyspora]|uniref:hypothetical protein n=1 Tax=unclassified Saccharopolyspora TaxID=2646250 RepID=UPI001CD256E6|nr:MULTISPECIES: hypothetical protein [unclassified Saccharopolyspora]MCA1184940.1 hypothetical protein [Saccharopolyspora sp. 6T]MCA1190661.1 hypothetical protein [Saccharopolyspora sp. 6V]MCA1225443.1 hypothetical protein [Saccharopolyspora sp. 6M]MCA1279894.1 hypothetical protein [Saccharopolyspora sp. 7B]